MVNRQDTAYSVRRRLGWKLTTSVAIACLAAGCTKLGKKDSPQRRVAAVNYTKQAERPPLKPNNPLHIATAQWARKHQKDPADADAALNYARSLKALGAKDKALGVLARTYQLNPRNSELASEYGRVALSQSKVQLAEQLLNQAMRGRGSKDWRVLSAMGTVNAKRGDHKKAQSYYLAALRKQPGATSVYNNLALSYALDGKAGNAEKLLKEAVDKGHNTRVVRQNLALVLGLQSKFDEAQKVAKLDLDSNKIDNNVTFMRNMVKTTRVAQAAPRQKQAPKADPVTTAALPEKKPKAARKPTSVAAVPVKTKAKTRATRTTVASAPLPSRKPARPALAASAPLTAAPESQTKAGKKDVLPWHTKPGKPKSTTHVAGLQTKKSGAAAGETSPRIAANWSVSVEEASGASRNTEKSARPARKADTFEFPAPR